MRPASANLSRMPRYALCLAIFCEVAIVYGLYFYADRMRPDQPGNAKDFWEIAGWIRWPDYVPTISSGGDYMIDEDRCYYTKNNLHGSWLCSLPKSEAMQIWPAVQSNLETLLSAGPIASPTLDAYAEWKASESSDLEALLVKIKESQVASNKYRISSQKLLDCIIQYRVAKAKRYYANFVFDFLWLSFLTWLIFYPLVRRTSLLRAFLHWQLAPVLFFSPAYLGYSADSYGPLGPSGGVLYPNLLVFFRGGQLSATDWNIIKSLPPALESLSQDFGALIALFGYGPWGPLPLLGFGVVLGFGCVALVR